MRSQAGSKTKEQSSARLSAQEPLLQIRWQGVGRLDESPTMRCMELLRLAGSEILVAHWAALAGSDLAIWTLNATVAVSRDLASPMEPIHCAAAAGLD